MNIRERYLLLPVLTSALHARQTKGQVGVSERQVEQVLKSRPVRFYARLLSTPIMSAQFQKTLAIAATMLRLSRIAPSRSG